MLQINGKATNIFLKDLNTKYLERMKEHIDKIGRDIVITDDRIPKSWVLEHNNKTQFFYDKKELRSIIDKLAVDYYSLSPSIPV